MSVATKAKALVSKAAVVVGVADVETLARQAADDLARAEGALEDALARQGFGECSESEVEAKRAARDERKRASEQFDAMLREAQRRDLKKAQKAEADRLSADWAETEKLRDKGVALVQQYVADCRRIEATVQELTQVLQRLDLVSPRRRASIDLRGLIVGPQLVSRLTAIMKALVPSLHRQPGIQPHAKGIESYIKDEIGLVRQFGDRH